MFHVCFELIEIWLPENYDNSDFYDLGICHTFETDDYDWEKWMS